MTEEVTRSCVRVLRAERNIIQFIKFILTPVWKACVWLFGLINWCIFRAVMRWFGIPVSILLFWKFENSLRSTSILSAWDFGFIIIIACIATAGIISWIMIPENERTVLSGKDVIETWE